MTREWYSVTDSADSVRIDIYGDIGESWWSESVSASQLLEMIEEADGKDIDLHINSGGGSVFDAFAMMTSLKNHNGRVTAYVDGLACSAASFLVAAADRIVVASVAWMMIHNASGVCRGTAADLREAAEWMDRVNDTIVGIYAKRGAKDADYYRSAMEAETWYSAEEAVEAGLADEIEEAVAIAACATDDRATLDSAPEAARELLDEAKRGERPCMPSAAPASGYTEDTLGKEDGGQGQEAPVPQAQERVVVIDSKLYRMKGKGAEHA